MQGRYARLLRATLGASLMLVAMVGTVVAGPFQDALAAYKKGDYATALQLFRPLADDGREDAQYYLGFMYYNGQGVAQDYAEAEKWFRLAADLGGRADAQYGLGLMYENGQGVAQDHVEAAKWWRLAADQNYTLAQANLGTLYATGQGVPQDNVRAYMWFSLAAARGDQIAIRNRDRVARQMTPTQIAEAQKLAGDWKSRPHREIVDMHQFPWSSIGKVGSGGQLCTGSVIGPNQLLTAAHCLYNFAAARFMSAGSINILLGYEKGEYRVHRVASRYTIPPAYDPSLITHPPDQKKLQIAARYDWAIVYIDEPFPADVRPLRLASETPSPGTAIKVAGYPIERRHILTADPHCQVAETSPDKKLFLHDCVAHHGDSGGPVLSRDDEGLILGVSVLSPSLLIELREQSKKAGIAVSAASISEFLGSQSGAGPSQAVH